MPNCTFCWTLTLIMLLFLVLIYAVLNFLLFFVLFIRMSPKIYQKVSFNFIQSLLKILTKATKNLIFNTVIIGTSNGFKILNFTEKL